MAQPTMPTPTHPAAPQEQQSQFPQELPPRKFTQTWMQRNKFSAKTFFTLHYKSFNPLHRRNARDLWRRISMILTFLARIALLILSALFLLSSLNFNAAGIVVAILFVLVGVAILLVNAWSLALIADASGVRRSCGIAVRRTGLDVFLHVQTFLHVLADATFLFWAVSGVALAAVWLFLGLLLLIVGLMASTEPIDEYGYGINV